MQCVWCVFAVCVVCVCGVCGMNEIWYLHKHRLHYIIILLLLAFPTLSSLVVLPTNLMLPSIFRLAMIFCSSSSGVSPSRLSNAVTGKRRGEWEGRREEEEGEGQREEEEGEGRREEEEREGGKEEEEGEGGKEEEEVGG